jgi:hypothetical protein
LSTGLALAANTVSPALLAVPSAVDDAQLASVRLLSQQIRNIGLTAAETPADSEAAVSFSLFPLPDPRPALADLAERIDLLLSKLNPIAVVETSADGQCLQTTVVYTMGAATVVSSNVSAAIAANHLTSLERTFALRNAVLGALAEAATSLLALSAVAANPLVVLEVISRAKALKAALDRLAAAARAVLKDDSQLQQLP